MQTSLVLTVIGRDRPGLVDALSRRINRHGGNWLDSRMANLAGQFAGLLLVKVPDDQAEALIAALKELETQGMRLLIERGDPPATSGSQPMRLELTGQDHPGIVSAIAEVLASQSVSIVAMETGSFSASFSGEAMFEMKASLQAPTALDQARLRQAIESLATDLMVEITIDDA